MRWNDVIKKCCDRYTDFKQNAAMHAIFNEIKENPKLSHERRLYPNREKPSTVFYSSNVLKEFDKHYTKNNFTCPPQKPHRDFSPVSTS